MVLLLVIILLFVPQNQPVKQHKPLQTANKLRTKTRKRTAASPAEKKWALPVSSSERADRSTCLCFSCFKNRSAQVGLSSFSEGY